MRHATTNAETFRVVSVGEHEFGSWVTVCPNLTLREAVQMVRDMREDGDGSETFRILGSGDRVVTGGDVRRAGL